MEELAKALQHIPRSVRNQHTVNGAKVEDGSGVEGVYAHPEARFAKHPHVRWICAAQEVWVEVPLEMAVVAQANEHTIASLKRNSEIGHIKDL